MKTRREQAAGSLDFRGGEQEGAGGPCLPCRAMLPVRLHGSAGCSQAGKHRPERPCRPCPPRRFRRAVPHGAPADWQRPCRLAALAALTVAAAPRLAPMRCRPPKKQHSDAMNLRVNCHDPPPPFFCLAFCFYFIFYFKVAAANAHSYFLFCSRMKKIGNKIRIK